MAGIMLMGYPLTCMDNIAINLFNMIANGWVHQIGDSVGIVMIQLPPPYYQFSYDNLNLIASKHTSVRYDTTIPPAWISHRHCVHYSPSGSQCKMGCPGAPAAGIPEEEEGRARGERD